MFRQRSLHVVAATTAVASATAARRYTSAPSTVWITITGDAEHPCGSSSPWTLRVPLEVSSGPAASWNSAGQTGRGGLHRSRTLLAPHTTSSMPGSHPSNNGSATAAAADHNGDESRGPYEVTIDEALLGPETTRGATVLDLVRLLVDPDAGADVEQVSLRDFAAMAPKRQLRAVAGDHECLGVLLGSEVYQSEKDARALRLMGITTVGQWREQPDRVQLSAYGRGVLEMAYASLSRHRQQSQKDLVVAWLTRTIQRAVAEELMAPKQLSAGADNNTAGHLPHHQQLSPSSDAQPSPLWVEAAAGAKARVAEAAAVAAGAAAAPATTTTSPPSDVQTSAKKAKNTLVKEDETKEEEADDDGNAAATAAVASSPRRGPRQRPVVSSVDKAKVKAAAAAAEETEEIIDEVDAERDEEVDTEMATLMAEAEAILKKEEPPVTRSAAAPSAATVEDAVPVEAEGEEEEEVEEVVEEVEEEEGEEAEEVKEAESGASTGKKLADAAPAPPAAASPTATTAAAAAARSGSGAPAASSTPSAAAAATVNAQQREKLARLAELMLKQFNTADGYLHPTNKAERTEQEQRGDILVLDEDTAQVDPLAMFSAYHAATVTEADPVGVRALKTIWTTYNKHQIALEEAADDATAEFYKHESVNALLYGSVLMRALAREEPVVVLEGTALPHYGFPLVSSDTRPFTSAAATSSATDMTPANISTAMHAYKTLFNDKEKRYSPFRPAIDQNAGCSVVRLSGTTLHLYYTSTKDHVMEEEVRLPFAEVMLGMLHLLRQKVLPRVNVVHYHLIATKLADASADLNFMLRSTATLDLTNPFTKEEHARLKALAAPLGMSEEMDEFRCIDDLVMEIEDNSGASVVHSLLHNREDLEATLTATLAQLLPEDVEVDAAAKDTAHHTEADEAVEEEEVAPSPPVAASSRKGKSAAAAAAAAASAPTPSRAGVAAARRPAPAADAEDDEAVEEAGEEEEEEDVEVLADEEGDLEAEDDEEEAVAPLPATRAKAHNTKKPMHHHHPAPPVAPTARRPAATPIKENVGDEEAELEEAIYTQWQKQKEQQQPQHRTAGSHKTTAAAKATAPSRGVAKPEMDDEEYAEEEELAEEEEEEVVAAKPAARAAASSPTRRNGAAHTRGAAPAPAAPLPAAVAGAGDEEEEEEFEEEEEEVEEVDEEDDDEMEVVTAPQLPRRPAGHRAVPVAVEEADADEEEAEEDEEEDEVEAPRRPSPPVQAHHRSTRHPSAAPTAAGAVPRTRGPPPPAAAAPQPAEEVEEAVDEESVPPPLPQVRTRRGAARRHSARSRPSALEDEQQSTSAGHGEDGSADAGEAVVADEDQWFRKKPKRRYFE